MSGILGVFDLSRERVDVESARHMLTRQSSRGDGRHQLTDAGSALLGVCRYDWELGEDHSGDVLLVDDGRFLVAADAVLLYLDELRRGLENAGVSANGESPSDYILAAYRAWQTDCVSRLEGSFAFIVYDRETHDIFCARDHMGMRPLYFAELGTQLVVASTIGAVLEHPECSLTLNLPALAAAAAGWLGALGRDTSYRDVCVVPMAGSMTWRNGSRRSWRHWDPGPVHARDVPPMREAAEQLRELLVRAVSECMSRSGTTAVSMSGGRDSTAVFAAGKSALRGTTPAVRLLPVSISYPEGDLGREDEHIAAIAERWESPVHWLPIGDIEMFDRDVERAATRDEPATSPYENWNVALARGAREHGARILLDGNGGDQLFRVGDQYLADLLRRFRWVELVKELRAKRSRGRRHLLRSTLHPLLPDAALRLIGAFRGTPLPSHLMAFPLPAWMRGDFFETHGLYQRQLSYLPPRRAANNEEAVLHWYVTTPMFGYAAGVLQQRLLEAGVDSRSPLLDRRIVDFALTRPRAERAQGLYDKRLLIESMRGLIPEDVLAPREWRTGVTVSYSRSSMADRLPDYIRKLLRSGLQLAELGLVEPSAVEPAAARLEKKQLDDHSRMALFSLFQAEIWLRTRPH